MATNAAEVQRQVAPGDTVVLSKTDNAITGAKADSGVVSVVKSTDSSTTHFLLYQAPQTKTPLNDKVTYADGELHSLSLKVNPEAKEGGAVQGDGVYADSFKTLFVLFVAAVLLESALATIFNWRPFLDYFDSRGVKTVVSVGVALVVVNVFDFDAVNRLLKIYGAGLDMKVGDATASTFPGKFLTALILAGGSSGVNNLLVALGFRSVRTAEQVKPKPPPEHAWVSVRLSRVKAVGPVSVLIGPKGGGTIAGVIAGTSAGSRVWRYFVRDRGRFPTSGGRVLPQDVEFEISLSGFDQKGNIVKSATPWGPYKLQGGAIVDIEMEL